MEELLLIQNSQIDFESMSKKKKKKEFNTVKKRTSRTAKELVQVLRDRASQSTRKGRPGETAREAVTGEPPTGCKDAVGLPSPQGYEYN